MRGSDLRVRGEGDRSTSSTQPLDATFTVDGESIALRTGQSGTLGPYDVDVVLAVDGENAECGDDLGDPAELRFVVSRNELPGT